MSLLIQLFLEFFKIGLFAVGGGLATIPFLHQLAEKYTWFTVETLVDMIAISESTPGAMGVNMATYTGFTTAGIPGSLVATLGLVLPSIVIIIIIAHFLKQFSDSPVVKAIFTGLKPAVAALILCAALNLVNVSVINLSAFRRSDRSVSVKKYYSVRRAVILNDENQKASDRLDCPVGSGRRPAFSVLTVRSPLWGVFSSPQPRPEDKLHIHFPAQFQILFAMRRKRPIKNPH